MKPTEDATPVPTPRVDAVGVVHYPPGWEASGGPTPRIRRIIAALVVIAFATVAIVTTIVSATRYCLTTDGANTTALTGRAPGGRADRP